MTTPSELADRPYDEPWMMPVQTVGRQKVLMGWMKRSRDKQLFCEYLPYEPKDRLQGEIILKNLQTYLDPKCVCISGPHPPCPIHANKVKGAA